MGPLFRIHNNARLILRWLLIIVPISVAVGSVVALFLWLLDLATVTRVAHPWLLFLLPVAGLVIVFSYRVAGKNAESGNNLILDEIHAPGAGVPGRMAPLVFAGTVVTHLFGGSAGREGTAVQIGGAISEQFCTWFRLNADDRRLMLTAGIAAGFGACFGTPLAGTIFALEVLAVGRIKFDAVIPALFAAGIADLICVAWGAPHTQYRIGYLEQVVHWKQHMGFNLLLTGKVMLAAVAFGLAGYLFGELMYLIKDFFKVVLKNAYMIVVAGGLIVIGLVFLIGNGDYIGLGVTASQEGGVSILSAFEPGGAQWYSWALKLVLTAVTLAAGFKGGEVTPLFFIGATLGNTLAWVMGAPVDLFAAIGLLAVFAAATNTPLACTIMGVELFGADHLVYFAIACFVAYAFSGHTGIYGSQRIAVPKPGEVRQHLTLSELRNAQNRFVQWLKERGR
jgi:H+/Cl- antiporter ClcA